MKCYSKLTDAGLSKILPSCGAWMLFAATVMLTCGTAHAIAVTPISINESYDSDNSTAHYTVNNPPASLVPNIVSFVITTDPQSASVNAFLARSDNSWAAQTLTQSNWDSPMEDDLAGSPFGLSWASFYGVEWPFGPDQFAAGYFVPYSPSGDGIYTFDNPSLAVSAGESQGGFKAVGVVFASAYSGVGNTDASQPFTPSSFSSFGGQSVPEPSSWALILLGSGLLSLWRLRASR